MRIDRSWWMVAALIVGCAAAIKQPAFLVAYALPLMACPWMTMNYRSCLRHGTRIFISCALSMASFVAISWMTGLGFGWINAISVPGRVITIAPFTVLGQGIQYLVDMIGIDPSGRAAVRIVRTVGVVLASLLVAVMAITIGRKRPVRFLSLAYLVVALALPAVRSWYLLWGGLILPISRPSKRTLTAAIWATIVLLSYNAINMAWRNDAVALGCALTVLIALIAKRHQYRHRLAQRAD